MESKLDSKADCKSLKSSDSKIDGSGYIDESLFSDEKKQDNKEDSSDDCFACPIVNVLDLKVEPSTPVDISAGLSLSILFEIDRDVIAGHWIIQYLVDSSSSRIVRILGETSVEDYTEGENEMRFEVPAVDIDGIEPSALTNAGLLMAKLMANGDEVISVNLVSGAKLPIKLFSLTFSLGPKFLVDHTNRSCKHIARVAIF